MKWIDSEEDVTLTVEEKKRIKDYFSTYFTTIKNEVYSGMDLTILTRHLVDFLYTIGSSHLVKYTTYMDAYYTDFPDILAEPHLTVYRTLRPSLVEYLEMILPKEKDAFMVMPKMKLSEINLSVSRKHIIDEILTDMV